MYVFYGNKRFNFLILSTYRKRICTLKMSFSENLPICDCVWLSNVYKIHSHFLGMRKSNPDWDILFGAIKTWNVWSCKIIKSDCLNLCPHCVILKLSDWKMRSNWGHKRSPWISKISPIWLLYQSMIALTSNFKAPVVNCAARSLKTVLEKLKKRVSISSAISGKKKIQQIMEKINDVKSNFLIYLCEKELVWHFKCICTRSKFTFKVYF